MAGNALMFKQRTPNLQLKQGGRKRKTTEEMWIPLAESRRSEGRVKLVELFSSIDLQKDYRGYTMVFDGRKFRKLVPGIDRTLAPSRRELVRFLLDIQEAAEHDKRIWSFLERNPLPYRLIRRKR